MANAVTLDSTSDPPTASPYAVLHLCDGAPRDLVEETYWLLVGKLRFGVTSAARELRQLDELNQAYEAITRGGQNKEPTTERKVAPSRTRWYGGRSKPGRWTLDPFETLFVSPDAEPDIIALAHRILAPHPPAGLTVDEWGVTLADAVTKAGDQGWRSKHERASAEDAWSATRRALEAEVEAQRASEPDQQRRALRAAEAEAKRQRAQEAEALAEARRSAEARERARRSAEAEALRVAEAQLKAQGKADAESRRQAKAEARRAAEAEAKAQREAQPEASRTAEAERREMLEQARRAAEAEAKAAEAAEAARAEANRKAQEQARRAAEAEARRLAEAAARAEAERVAAAEARRLAEAAARAEAERAAEAEARRLAEAAARAEAERVAAARAEAERVAAAEARRVAEAEARRTAEETLARDAAAREKEADASGEPDLVRKWVEMGVAQVEPTSGKQATGRGQDVPRDGSGDRVAGGLWGMLEQVLARGERQREIVERENERVLTLRDGMPAESARDDDENVVAAPEPVVARDNGHHEVARPPAFLLIGDAAPAPLDLSGDDARQFTLGDGPNAAKVQLWRRGDSYMLQQISGAPISIGGQRLTAPIVVLEDGDEIAHDGSVMRIMLGARSEDDA